MKNPKARLGVAIACFGFACVFSQSLSADNRLHVSKTFPLPTGRTTEININIDAAEVDIRPVDGENVIVKADFDRRDYDLNIEFDEDEPSLDIEFDKDNWNDDHNGSARILIEIPMRPNIILDAKLKAGEIDIELGGVALEELELTTWAGEVEFGLSDRNRVVCRKASINTKVGETRIIGLSNLRFENIDIDGGIGEMRIDFRGHGEKEASAEIDLDIGETHIEIPNDLGVRLAISKFLFLTEVDVSSRFEKSGNRYYSKEFDSSERTLELEVSPGLGSFHIR